MPEPPVPPALPDPVLAYGQAWLDNTEAMAAHLRADVGKASQEVQDALAGALDQIEKLSIEGEQDALELIDKVVKELELLLSLLLGWHPEGGPSQFLVGKICDAWLWNHARNESQLQTT